MVDLKKIGQTIESLRKNKNMTQDDLASALYVSRQAVSKWETGKGMPSIDLFIELTKLFNVSIDAIIDGSELSKEDYEAKFSQLPRTAVFANFIQSNNLEKEFHEVFYLLNQTERKQFIDLLINHKIHLPYKTVWPHLSEDERIYLLGYILSHEEDQLDELTPHLNHVEEQMIYKKRPYKKITYHFNRKD
jgi:transcriptional regulator with XRE-family HTH domain